MSASEPFASIEEFQTFWKPLTGSDNERASSLLLLASNRLRLIAYNRGENLDNKANGNELYLSNLKWVVMESVKRAMLTPSDTPPANSISRSAGPYSENITFTNPAGDLWFKKSELSDLGLGGQQTMRSYSTVPNNSIYAPYDQSW